MDWNGLLSLVYGLTGGFFEFLPVPPEAQQSVLLKLTGSVAPISLQLPVYLGCFLAVFLSYYSRISKIRREKQIAAISPKKRKRQPDGISLLESRLLRTAMVPLLVSVILAPWLRQYFKRIWVLAILLLLNGAVLLLPQYLPGSNKDARSLSPLDAFLIGFSAVLGVIPGISPVATMIACAKIRGADQEFSLDFIYLLLIPALAAMCITELVVIVFSGGGFSGWLLLYGILSLIGATASALAGISLMRFLAVKIGFSGFAYYSIGLGMFTFILYLIG